MSELWLDVRFALRLLSRSPVFAITASLLLGIGIGANTLIFSIVDKLLLRPLAVKDADRLVRLIEVHPNNFITWDLPLTLFEALDARKGELSVTNPICQGELDVAFDTGGTTERIRANAVSRNFFSELGMKALQGRVLTAEDDASGALVAVISYDFWQRRFAGSPAAVGSKIRLTGRNFTVVGVLPKGANGVTVDTTPDIRVPITAGKLLIQRPGLDANNPMIFRFQIFGKLRPGVTPERAEAEAEPMLRSVYNDALIRGIPEMAKNSRSDIFDSRLRLEPAAMGISSLRSKFSASLGMLMGCVGLLLLMACANVAGLVLARAAGRAQEVSLRLVLGANPWRVVRQLLTESFVLGLMGGILGLAIAYTCMPLLLSALPPIRDRGTNLLPLSVNVEVDPRVLGFALFASVLTAILFGLSPALHGVRENLGGAVRGTRGATARLSGRNILVVAQVAVCVLLLVGSGLLLETFEGMKNLNPGFDRDRLVTFTVDPGMQGYDSDRAGALARQLMERVRTLPGVAGAALSTRPVMRGSGMVQTIGVAGRPIAKSDFLNCSTNGISPGYFETMGIRLLAGTDFSASDEGKEKPLKIVVNQAFVRRFFPGVDAVGKLVGTRGPDGNGRAEYQIAGVVSDAKYRSLREPSPPTIYSLAVKNLDYGFILNVRAQGPPEGLINSVRDTLRALDSQVPLVEIHTMKEEVDMSLWQERLLARLSALFSGFAALLAAIGLYGALDFVVKSRTREIGVRVALGASPGRVAWMLSLETVLLVGAGVALGLTAYAASMRWIRQALYGVAPTDPKAIAMALLFVAAVTLLAAAPPIWRAVRIDASTALRYE